MNLEQLRTALDANTWQRGADDVEILVDNGNGEAYTLVDLFDQGNLIVVIGDRAPGPITVTDAMVAAFGQAWENTAAGEPGTRRRAGLNAALSVMR